MVTSEVREGMGYSEARLTDDNEAPGECWEPNLGPLPAQTVPQLPSIPLTPDPPFCLFVCLNRVSQ